MWGGLYKLWAGLILVNDSNDYNVVFGGGACKCKDTVPWPYEFLFSEVEVSHKLTQPLTLCIYLAVSAEAKQNISHTSALKSYCSSYHERC